MNNINLPDNFIPPDFLLEKNNLEGFSDILIERVMRELNVSVPGEIIAYNTSTTLATVKILANLITSAGQILENLIVSNVQVAIYSGGGYLISAPLEPGDKGYLIAADYDLTMYKQNGNTFSPLTSRTHEFNDSLFLPCILKDYTIPNSNKNGLSIQTNDGSTSILIENGKITLTGDIYINGNILEHNSVNVGNTHYHEQPADSAGDVEQPTGYPQ